MSEDALTGVVTDGPCWDLLTDPDNPQPLIYPVCGDCDEAYEYRRFLSWKTGKYVWAWSKPAKVPKGCRHKTEAAIHNEAAG